MIVSTTEIPPITIVNDFLPIYIVVMVSFEGDDMIQFVSEDLSSKQVCVLLSHTELQREITVTVATEEGTASGNVYSYIQ